MKDPPPTPPSMEGSWLRDVCKIPAMSAKPLHRGRGWGGSIY